MDISNVPQLTVALPLFVLVGSWVVAKVLRLSFGLATLGALLPLGLPFVELPFEAEFITHHPLVLIGGGWLVMIALGIGWVIARPLAGSAFKGAGPLKVVYMLGMCTALLVVALLIGSPAVLEEYAPGWRGPAGVALLCVSCLSMAVALLRAMRAAALCAVWALVSVVLASEIFLNKLPNEVVREDLRGLEAYIPTDTLSKTIDELAQGLTTERAERVRALVLGDSVSTGYPYTETQSLAGQLRAEFERTGSKIDVRDLSLERATVLHTRRIADKVSNAKSDLVLIVGWAADSERGVNSYGIPGLSEREAHAEVERRAALRAYPVVPAILDSKLYKFTKGLWEREEAPEAHEISYRVPPVEYEAELSAAVDAFVKRGSTVVLVPEAVGTDGDSEYRAAMEKVARASGALFVNSPAHLDKEGQPTLFARGRLIASTGYKALAQAAVEALRQDVVPERGTPALKAALAGASVGGFKAEDPRFSGVVGQPVRMLIRPSDVTGDLVFKLRTLEEGTRYYRAVFSVDGRFVADRRTDSRDGIRVRFQLPPEVLDRPLVEIAVRTMASPPPDEDNIGTSQFTLPTSVSISAAPGAPARVAIGGQSIVSMTRFSGAALDPRSGDVLSVVRADDPRAFSRWVHAQPWGTMIAAVDRLGGGSGGATDSAYKYVGIKGQVPSADPVAFIGICGAPEGAAIVQSAKNSAAVSLRRGSSILSAYERFVLEDAWIGEQSIFGNA